MTFCKQKMTQRYLRILRNWQYLTCLVVGKEGCFAWIQLQRPNGSPGQNYRPLFVELLMCCCGSSDEDVMKLHEMTRIGVILCLVIGLRVVRIVGDG